MLFFLLNAMCTFKLLVMKIECRKLHFLHYGLPLSSILNVKKTTPIAIGVTIFIGVVKRQY